VKKPNPSGWAAFLRLWFVLFFSYLLLKFLFNLVVLGWVDLRASAFQELLVLPSGQSVVFWFITRRQRRVQAPAATPPAT
jgi:hypothetical protein